MGSTTTTTTNSIPGASGQEQNLMALLTRLAGQFGGQMGDLSQLASGNVGGPTQQDTELVQASIGRTADMAQRELERVLGPALAKLNENTAQRNTGGSSMEQIARLLQGREIGDQLQQILSGAQQQGGQALLNLPFQRAETKIGANQALFNMLSGAANPVLANQLQARLAQGTQKTETPMNWSQIFSTAGSIAGIPGLPWNKQ